MTDARNQTGPIARGKDGLLDALIPSHLRAYLITGDTLLGLLLGALDGSEPDIAHTREPHERFAHFNALIDKRVGVEASYDEEAQVVSLVFLTESGAVKGEKGIPLRIPASEILFALDRDAYVEALRYAEGSFLESPDDLESEPTEIGPSPPDGGEEIVVPRITMRPVVMKNYSGRFVASLPQLETFMKTELKTLRSTPNQLSSLASSLLATFDENVGSDWTVRETLLTRIFVVFKRVLSEFGISGSNAQQMATEIRNWFVENLKDAQGS